MKRFGRLVLGGIESKIFNAILITIILLTAAFVAVYFYHSEVLTQLSEESGRRQQESIGEITGQVMDAVVEQSLTRSNRTEAAIADAMFDSAAQRVNFLADFATKLLAHPENYGPAAYADPDPADDGAWTAKVLYAEGTDPGDPAVTAKLGLLANLTETMRSLCPALKASTIYIGLPEGAHLSMSATSSSWFTDGLLRKYDPRERGWYQKAAAEGRTVFTNGEWDANTGEYCIECAAPVYGPDGSLQAVVGTDMFLTEMEQAIRENAAEGELFLLLNQDGRPVLEPQAEKFPMDEADRKGDVRLSAYSRLAQAASDALEGRETGIETGELADGGYYLTASPIPSTGWVLISAFSEETAAQPIVMLQESQNQIRTETTQAYREKKDHARIRVLILMAGLAVLILGGALLLGKHIVKPLNTITRRISGLREGNLEFRMEDVYRTGDEVEELAESFATLSHKTVEYVETVKQVTAEKERIGAELSLATQIQASMLPHIFPAFPDRKEFDIYASMDPAKEVGGDFYDYFLIDDDHLCTVIADVSGKGVPAALFMMATKIILHSVAMMGKSPAEILARTNEAICSNNETGMFVTVWLGILEISTGKMVCANAGHEYPVFKKPDGSFEVFRDRHGFVVGGLEEARYRNYEIQMEPGTKMFVYTDGVPEATNAGEELFGTDRMIDALNGPSETDPVEVLKTVRKAVDGFVKDAEQFDDLTMLCLEYKGPAAQEENA